VAGDHCITSPASNVDTFTAAVLPADQTAYERSVTSLRSSLDAASFESAWQAGWELTLDQAVALALSSTA
jgi:hypothetical protein